MIYKDIGTEIIIAKTTSLKKSSESSVVILETEAPSILRIPISLVRRSMVKAVNPKRPRQAINMDRKAKIRKILAGTGTVSGSGNRYLSITCPGP